LSINYALKGSKARVSTSFSLGIAQRAFTVALTTSQLLALWQLLQMQQLLDFSL